VAYFGIGYFDQMQFAWFALLAIICVAVSETTRATEPEAPELASAMQVEPRMEWSFLEMDR
jgi:hypothetical protein